MKIRKLLVVLISLIGLTACSPNMNTIDSEKSSDNTSSLTVSTASLPVEQKTPIATFPVCLDVPQASICIDEVIATQQDTKLMLELLPDSNKVEIGWLAFILPDTEREEQPLLLDENGNSLSLILEANDFIAEFDSERKVYKQILVFEAIKSEVKQLTLKIPLVSLKVLGEESFQVDLGTNPLPGQIILLDTSFSIGNQDFHLNKAEFEGDGSNSLRVTLYSEPVDLPDEIASIQPVLGASEGISVGFGSKTIVDGWPFRAFADLIPQPGQAPVSGVINVPVQGMIYNYRGPFKITFSLP